LATLTTSRLEIDVHESSRVVVYGCGGHGKVIADAVLAAGRVVVGFVDDQPSSRELVVLGLPVLAVGRDESLEFCRREGLSVAVAVGDNRSRAMLFERLRVAGLTVATVVHPMAVISRSARLGMGTVALACAVVNADAEVGEDAILNTGCVVEHDCRIGSHVHIGPGVHLGGNVWVGDGTQVGLGSCVRNKTRVGSWSLVGAGAVVVAPVPDGATVVGNPARPLRSRGDG
jgi:sugar O-acyltransferase (sialic acid O-acetyltransferase NeuD family)